jgi:hypothetical protein
VQPATPAHLGRQRCKGRGSIHASSHGLSAGGTRLPGRVDRRPRGMDHLRERNRQGSLLLDRADAYVAPSYSIGCAAAEEHSWGVGDRPSDRGTLSGKRERERERERDREREPERERGALNGHKCSSLLVVRRTCAS